PRRVRRRGARPGRRGAPAADGFGLGYRRRPRGRRRRGTSVITGRISMLVAVGGILATATGGVAAAADGPTVGGTGVVAPSADYATEVLGNPFDYADGDDALVDGLP